MGQKDPQAGSSSHKQDSLQVKPKNSRDQGGSNKHGPGGSQSVDKKGRSRGGSPLPGDEARTQDFIGGAPPKHPPKR